MFAITSSSALEAVRSYFMQCRRRHLAHMLVPIPGGKSVSAGRE